MKTIELNKASEFLDYLRLSNPRWGENLQQNSDWIFRGQRSQNWKIVPVAWREKDFNPLTPLIESIEPTDEQKNYDNKNQEVYENWIRAERSAIIEFVNGAEKIGADTTLSPRQHYRIRRDEAGGNPTVHDTAAAMAQHHGIPTRLLDWTTNPLTAAFFSSNSFQAKSTDTDKVCVYALNLPNVDSKYIDQNNPYLQLKPPINSKNEYLRNQEGLLLEIVNPNKFFLDHGIWPNLEEVLKLNDLEDNLEQITLPHSEAYELLLMLDREGTKLSKLMPTLDNVASEIIQKWQRE